MKKKFYELGKAINSIPLEFVSKFNSVYRIEFVIEGGKNHRLLCCK